MAEEISAFLGEPDAAGAQQANALTRLEDADATDEGLSKHDAELLVIDVKVAC